MPVPMPDDRVCHEGPRVERVGDFDVIDCLACGFRHVLPLPDPESLERIYRHEYYSEEKPLYLERHEADREWWQLVHDERLERFEALLNTESRRVLDVGCGPGLFLDQARCRGWSARGIEPSRQAAAHCRAQGLDVVNDFLGPASAASLGRFDAVHLSEVLEHIPDPAGMLETIRGLLVPEGVLCVVVPNDYSPFQQALREVEGFEPWWVVPPHHLNYFDRASLGRLLERSGFEVLATEATFPIDLFLLMGENYVGNDELGRQCHARRKRLELTLEKAGLRGLKRDLYAALAKHGIGRELVVFARRREGGA